MDVQEALDRAKNHLTSGILSPDLKLFLDQPVEPVNFVQHFAAHSNLSEAQVVRLLHIFFQGEFVGSEEDFLGVVENQASWPELTTKLLNFLFAERSYLLRSIEFIIIQSQNPAHRMIS